MAFCKVGEIGALSDAVFEQFQIGDRRIGGGAVDSDLEQDMPCMNGFAVPLEELNDMKPARCLHNVRDLVFLQAEDHLFELFHELTAPPGTEIATRRGGPGVLCITACQHYLSTPPPE